MVAHGQQCTDCLDVTRDWLLHDGTKRGLGLLDEDLDVADRPIARWYPCASRMVRSGSKQHSKHAIPYAPMEAPFEKGLVSHGLPTEKSQLSIIAGRIEDKLADQDKDGWNWLCGFCPAFKHFFFYQYGPEGQTSASQWVWPQDKLKIFQVPIAVTAGN